MCMKLKTAYLYREGKFCGAHDSMCNEAVVRLLDF